MRTHILELKTRARTEFVPLSARIAKEASALLSGSGALLVSVPHTTVGVCVNEGADPDVVGDMARVLDRMVPWESPDYRHSEGNTAAHVKAAKGPPTSGLSFTPSLSSFGVLPTFSTAS